MKHVECLTIFVILLFCSLTITMYLNLTGNFPRIPAIIRTTIDNNTLAVLMKRYQLLEQTIGNKEKNLAISGSLFLKVSLRM